VVNDGQIGLLAEHAVAADEWRIRLRAAVVTGGGLEPVSGG
jgi:hypothetical protein